MIEEKLIKQLITGAFVIVLLVFAFLIIRPIFLAIILGLILAYVFNPLDKWLLKRIKNETVSASITCTITIGLLLLILWFSLPLLTKQIFDSYMTIVSMDIIGFLKKIFPFMFTNPQISANIEAAYGTFLSTTANDVLKKFTNILINFPTIALKLIIVLIVFFYGLRDGDKILDLMRESLPFNKTITNRFIEKSKKVTFSVIYGRIIVGILVGIIAGIGFYLAGLKSTLLLTVLVIIASILPLIGPGIIWIPASIGLILTDKFLPGIFLFIYCGIVVTLFENISHTIFVSKKSEIQTSLTLIGLIGGMLVFGLFGIILGPLIIAYLSVLFELYREYNLSKTS